jgi:hypothetical protein
LSKVVNILDEPENSPLGGNVGMLRQGMIATQR